MEINKETVKKVSAKVHEELLNTSHLFIDETVATLSRMQRITGKVIKKSEPILEKQIDITFDAVEALKNQAEKGGKRALKLFGLTRQYNKWSSSLEEKIKEIPTVEEMIDDAKEIVGKAKSDVEERIEDISNKLNIGNAIETTDKVKNSVSTANKKSTQPKKVATKKISARKPTASKSMATDLTKIKGIGPSLAGIMKDNGIATIKDLAKSTPTALKVIASRAGNRYKSFDTKLWIKAAKAMAK